MQMDAKFSDCGKYRHVLTRIWEPESSARLAGLIGKNPSVASSEINDHTIRKEIAFAKAWGCRGLVKVNMYDYIATDSDELLKVSDSLRVSGNGMVSQIVQTLIDYQCKPVVCCWGTHSKGSLASAIRERGDMILRALCAAGIEPMCFRLNSDGTPGHPLRLGYKTKLVSMCSHVTR